MKNLFIISLDSEHTENIKEILNSVPDYNVIEFEKSELNSLFKNPPDLILMEILNVEEDIKKILQIRASNKFIKILVISGNLQPSAYKMLLHAGIKGSVIYHVSKDELEHCIDTIIDNDEIYLDRTTIKGLAALDETVLDSEKTSLTKNEIKLLKKISLGKPDFEIASEEKKDKSEVFRERTKIIF